MDKILNWFNKIVVFLSEYFMINSFGDLLKNVIEILLIAFVIYKIIELVRDSRAWQLLKGVLFIALIAWAAGIFGLNTISFLLNNMVQLLAFALIVVFQDEIKKILERLGNSNFKNIFNSHTQEDVVAAEKAIADLADAACSMSAERIGALLVIEREIRLGEIIATGVNIGSNISKELVEQIFVPNTPLHDGAVVIRGNKIMAASCLLPLTSNINLSKELGTRHRAAIGITEKSDCVVVVVSEETGKISVTMEGKIRRGFDKDTLTNFLRNTLLSSEEPKKRNLFKWRTKK